MLWICVRLIAWERVFCCLRGNIYSCFHAQVWECEQDVCFHVRIKLIKADRVSIMNVRVANVNLKSSNSALPLGVNQDAETDYLGFLAFVLQFLLHFANSSMDRNRRMKLRHCPCRITVFIPESWRTTHHLLTEEARNKNGSVQNLHLPDRCCIRLLQIKSVSKC